MEDFKLVELYRCEHCLDHHCYNEHEILEHLKQCHMNPINKSCIRCNKLRQRNEIDVESGKPLQFYECIAHKRLLDDLELHMMGAECFETREDKKIAKINSKEYEDYLETLVTKIESTLEV